MFRSRILATAVLATSATLPALAAHAWTLATLYGFKGGTDGANPQAGVTYNGGVLYGTTADGGSAPCEVGCGTVFAVNAGTGAETVLYRFTDSADGASPIAALIYWGGALYGTTRGGGVSGYGTVFRVDVATGSETPLYGFTGGADGGLPTSGLIYQGGILFGTTNYGGTGVCANRYFSGCGTVYEVNATSGYEKVLHSFTGGTDEAYPLGGLIYQRGTLYGTTFGLPYGGGTVFKVDPITGAEAVLYRFTGGADGGLPAAGLIDQGGILYGTTSSNVFKLNPTTGAETGIHSFNGGADGEMPMAGLIYVGGALYGTTFAGGGTGCGGSGCGTVFKVIPATGAESVLHRFRGKADGGKPLSGLIYEGDAFYGTTSAGGGTGCGGGCGTVFKLTP